MPPLRLSQTFWNLSRSRGNELRVMRRDIQKSRRKVSLATLFAGLVIASVLLTATILLTGSYQLKKQSLYQTTLSLNEASAAKMAKTMDSLFGSMRLALKQGSRYVMEHREWTLSELQGELEFMRDSSSYFNSIVIVDGMGVMRGFVPDGEKMIGRKVQQPASLEALASHNSYLSSPYQTTTSKKLIVLMSEPLVDKQGNYQGIIGGTLYLQEENIIHSIFGSSQDADKESYLYVVGPTGRLIYHPDVSRRGEDVSSNPIVQKVLEGKSGSLEAINTKGVAQLAGYASVKSNGWGVVIVSPISQVQEQLNSHLRQMLLYIAPASLLLMLGAIWLARRLVRPFVQLAHTVSGFGLGRAEAMTFGQHWNREADMLTKTVALAMVNLKLQTDQLTREATTDPLTGLANRRTLEGMTSKWIEDQFPFAVLILDIDHFKTINDSYGHPAGDQVLKKLSALLLNCIHPGDACFRYGGEEFVVVLPLAPIQEALNRAEDIRLACEQADMPIGRGITISIGCAHFPSHASSAQELFERADQALYQAKEQGRNRVCAAELRAQP